MVWVLFIGALIWAIAAQVTVKAYSKELKNLTDIKASKAKVVESLKIQTFFHDLYIKYLIRLHGPKKAAQIYISCIENAPFATDALENLYETYDLPKKYATQFSYTPANGAPAEWNSNDWYKNNAKYEKMLLRSISADFENVDDELKAYERRNEEIYKESDAML